MMMRYILILLMNRATGYLFVPTRHVKNAGTPVGYVTLHFGELRGAASLRYRNRDEITVLVCE